MTRIDAKKSTVTNKSAKNKIEQTSMGRMTRSKTAANTKNSNIDKRDPVNQSDDHVLKLNQGKSMGATIISKSIVITNKSKAVIERVNKNEGRMTRSKTATQIKNPDLVNEDVNGSKVTEKRKHSDLDIDSEMNTTKKPRIETSKLTIQKKQPKKLVSSVLSLKPSLKQFEIVWAHVRGFANWPGIIEEETKTGKYLIHFFGDYTRSEVTKSKIMHLMEGFNQFATVQTPSMRLTKAIREAQFFILDKDRSTCPICDMLKMKLAFVNKKALTDK